MHLCGLGGTKTVLPKKGHLLLLWGLTARAVVCFAPYRKKTAAVRPFIRTLFIKFKHAVFYDSNPSGPLIIFQFRRDIRSQSCLCRTLRVKQFFLVNQHTYYTVPQIFSFMIDVFTPNRISPDCPFKRNQRHMKILIFDSAVCSLSLWCDAHRRDWLPGVMHTRVEWFLKKMFAHFMLL